MRKTVFCQGGLCAFTHLLVFSNLKNFDIKCIICLCFPFYYIQSSGVLQQDGLPRLNEQKRLQSRMAFIVQVEGNWIEWNPPIGLVDAIGQRAVWIAAAAYGRAIRRGESEVIAQQEAERAAYCAAYRVQY